ncbi:hypothetical protein [Haloarcula sp. 1CSR25-25]|uniref:hypothetical protein n=1 Tax=Haloarcula sp. 1CSR25-25 TaxID=2862545 RepID=UPI002896058F|nr:hypothetical protein [Haloarcula sp. 1CSR25-25]MDT3437779.1 hypothetical protein [Haloarcula sp. 1CSR25-25]
MSQSKSQSTLSGDAASVEQTTDEESEEELQASLVDGVEPTQSSPTEATEANDNLNGEEEKGAPDDGEEGLEEFGVEEDARPNNPKLDNPDGEMEADRRVNRRNGDDEDTGTQKQLFPDVEDDQATLTGGRARNQCLFD